MYIKEIILFYFMDIVMPTTIMVTRLMSANIR